jgi:hypothetical protein
MMTLTRGIIPENYQKSGKNPKVLGARGRLAGTGFKSAPTCSCLKPPIFSHKPGNYMLKYKF